MTIKVVNPGLATSVQDLGREGYFHLGIPQSGAMDRYSAIAANRLVGNADGAAVLETAFMGPTLTFEIDSIVAVTGAEMPVKIDGETQPLWTALQIRAGQTLSFDFLKAGARAYIAVAGGIDVPEVLGSRSTYVIGALGGLEGRMLKAGDVLPVGEFSGSFVERQVPAALRRDYSKPCELRVLPGLYMHRITEAAQEAFFADNWKVAPEADRMGYRFKGGRPLDFVPREAPFGAGSDPSNIVDSCYSYGSIQVPAGAEPIVLHRDAVSGGGYFTIGAVISADMDLIGQLQPHQGTRFVKVTMEEAVAAREAARKRLVELAEALK
jgi:biotin-dependent carboxylase-like uncharacterized protein